MPNIAVKTNVTISKETETALKAQLGEAIALLPGKSEAWLMCSFEDNCRLWFQGNDAPAAFAQVQVYGKINSAAADRLTGALCETLSASLGVPQNRIYVKYEEISLWGWNGSNF